MRKCILAAAVLLILTLGIDVCFAAPRIWAGDAKLTLEQEPEVGGIAVIKIKARYLYE